jgi:hypothetical protein
MQAAPVNIEWHPGLSICASEAFLKTAGSEYGWLGGFDIGGKLRCVLPYTIVRKAILRMVRFRTETIGLDGELSEEQEQRFLDSVVEHFRAKGTDVIVPASANALFRTSPKGALSAPYGSYVVDLTQAEEALWTNLHSKHRNVIRNAKTKKVEIRTGPDLCEQVHQLVKTTLGRSKMGFMSLEKFRGFVSSLGDHVKLFIAEHEGKIQGAAAIPFSQHSAYYLYGGSVEKPLTGAMNLLHWEAMCEFRKAGVRRYDLMGVRLQPEKGSKQEGLMMFKARFGGELKQGVTWKIGLKPAKYFLYSLLARIRDGGDVVDQERGCKACSK